MDFALDNRTEELRAVLLQFMDDHVYPAESVFRSQLDALDDRWAWDSVEVLADLRSRARALGLWNLFLPGPHGAQLTNVQYAPLAEVTGRSPYLAPAALNCSAPDSGNMELLSKFGTPAQQSRWLDPLLEGQIRSAFAMTEPAVASSDATNVATSITRAGDDYVINGSKWWISGAMNPNAQVFIVLGVSDPKAQRHRRHTMILVPRDTPGLHIGRGLTVLGYNDSNHGGHAEITFDDVRVSAENVILGEGEGFAVAQGRLGPGRIHHCMRSIGLAERMVELMCQRVSGRTAFGKPLSEQGVIRSWIAESRVRLEQLRLLVMRAAWTMDTAGNRAAHGDIQAIKVATPTAVEWIVDKAIQAHGAGGLCQDFPLAEAYASARTMRIVDGPDEVHMDAIARRELKRHTAGAQ